MILILNIGNVGWMENLRFRMGVVLGKAMLSRSRTMCQRNVCVCVLS